MNQCKQRWAFGTVVVMFWLAGLASAEDPKPTGGQPPDQGFDAAMMEAWDKLMAPGEHHKMLEPMAGRFTYVNTFRMDPSQPEMTSQGTYEGTMVFGGRYLMSLHKGEMMGRPYEGLGILGYDNQLQKHVSIWLDSMGTGILRTEGTCADNGKSMTFEGEMPDPMQGGKLVAYRYKFEIPNEDEFSFHWWAPGPTSELFEAMTIHYTRVK
ncbi:MAG: DUF1579 domain-containing protein [Phycisphaerae bacterium]|nr:DUF1579 domain-containing protein [Phycisphaerae bacterium]MDW8263425.1 DUF1579 domain-containing protein [Phycisphaerales bacterium]